MNEAVALKTAKTYSPEDFYLFGREKLKHKQIADRIGTNHIGVSQILKLNPALREALEKGKAGIGLSDELSLASKLEKDVPDREKISAPSLDPKTIKAIKTALARKLYFLPDIAGFTGIDSLTVYNTLADLVASGEVIKDDSVKPHSFRLATGADKFKPEEKPVPEPISKEEIEAQILAAIDDFHCTLPQIKKHAGFERSFDLTDHLETLLAEETILRMTNGIGESGTLTAYFRFNNPPKRFWLEDGKCAVEMPTEEEKKVSQPRKHSEIVNRYTPRETGETILLPEISEAENEFAPEPVKSARKAPKGIDWTPALLENLAAEHSLISRAAKSIGVVHNSLKVQISKNAENTAAWERGQKAFKEAKKGNTPSAENAAASETALPISDAALETAKRFCEENPQLVDDPNTVEKFVEYRKNQENVVSETSESPKLFAIDEEAVQFTFDKDVSLSNGVFLATFEGNFFCLTRRERRILLQVIDLIEDLEMKTDEQKTV